MSQNLLFTRGVEPGTKVLFQVSHGGAHGQIWKINSKPYTNDVYLAAKIRDEHVKISFHQSGQWHYKLSEKVLKQYPELNKYQGISRKRSEIANGWLYMGRIFVPKASLIDGNPTSEAVFQVPINPKFNSVSIEIFMQKEKAPPLKIDDGCGIAQMKLPDGKLVAIVARGYDLQDSVLEEYLPILNQASNLAKGSPWENIPTTIIIPFLPDPEYGYFTQLELRTS